MAIKGFGHPSSDVALLGLCVDAIRVRAYVCVGAGVV